MLVEKKGGRLLGGVRLLGIIRYRKRRRKRSESMMITNGAHKTCLISCRLQNLFRVLSSFNRPVTPPHEEKRYGVAQKKTSNQLDVVVDNLRNRPDQISSLWASLVRSVVRYCQGKRDGGNYFRCEEWFQFARRSAGS